jgi:hypothetical protein
MRVRFCFEIRFKHVLTWPDYYLHEYILALWGMPLGEMLDLEKLAQTCHEKNRYFFFFTSAPANCPGMFLTCHQTVTSLTTQQVE